MLHATASTTASHKQLARPIAGSTPQAAEFLYQPFFSIVSVSASNSSKVDVKTSTQEVQLQIGGSSGSEGRALHAMRPSVASGMFVNRCSTSAHSKRFSSMFHTRSQFDW